MTALWVLALFLAWVWVTLVIAKFCPRYPMSEFRDRVPHEGLQCGARYGRFGCCLNAGHVQLGQMHLGVGADGHIIEWSD